MSRQRRVSWVSAGAVAIIAIGASTTWGQESPGRTTRIPQAGERAGTKASAPRAAGPAARSALPGEGERPEIVLQNALRENPFTAPYAISTTSNKGVIVLSGRVGTKQ